MKLALPTFQFRFMRAAGNVIFPGNFHPVGAQRDAELMVARACLQGSPTSRTTPDSGGRTPDSPARAPDSDIPLWLIVGGSGGFGSAARIALACDHGADTINISLDAEPNPESSNKIRKIGSPAWHRNAAIERQLQAFGRAAFSHPCDAFDPVARAAAIAAIQVRFPGRKLAGIVWALAAPRGLDPRTGHVVSSSLKPLGKPATVKTFTGPEGSEPPRIVELALEPGTPEEAIATQWVMGGRVVETWIDALLAADLLAPGHTLLTISYRGSPLNAPLYRDGMIGLAKADLEFTTAALSTTLQRSVGGRAFAVEGPAVVTEASGGIPGVPLYLALLLDIMGDKHEDPLTNMRRLFAEHNLSPVPGVQTSASAPKVDAQGLIRMDEHELTDAVQDALTQRFAALAPGDAFELSLYERFMAAYARTRGFGVPGVDYETAFDTEDVC